MNSEIERIENILTNAFTLNNYIKLMKEIFSNMNMLSCNSFNKEYSNFSFHIEGTNQIGTYLTPDEKKILIFAVKLKKGSYVENSRSKQRSYAKKLIENGNADAAMIAFYKEDDPKWRLSFVRLDYGFNIEDGKIKAVENLTPAKRYSYLLGKEEPCHTAIERFKMFITDSNSKPTLDELEEVFSVEKVTKEFFNLYCEKYHELREHLESNSHFLSETEHHNFTAAQFAKKLMGQIVFLYFLQKKGWLGVNIWSKALSEKEYKNALYAKGQKSIKHIPNLYKLAKDGKYYLDGKVLASLSEEDEEDLSNCVKGQPWGTGSHNFMRRLFVFSNRKDDNFYDEYLEPLFYEALNVNRGEKGYCSKLHCRIPFLSGGLFEPIDGYDWENNDFNIPNYIFSNREEKGERNADGILDIFDRYNFTMCEDEPMEKEVAIDPEMLGKVFENLLEVKDRKSKGAFYTPREIVHYMCQESLISYLGTETNIEEDIIREFVLYGDFMKDEDTVKKKREGNGGMLISKELFEVDSEGSIITNRLGQIDEALKNIRVADPAVGSGAFPLGMLNEIVRARQNITAYITINMESKEKRLMYMLERSPYELKYQTIKNCIFAADIEPSAVDIAQLRLWLALVIDDEINPYADNPLEGHKNPLPLPNLECNILCGNSLIDEFEGVRLINESEIIGNTKIDSQIDIYQSSFESVLPKLIEAQDELFRCDDPIKKIEVRSKVNNYKDLIIQNQMQVTDSDTVRRYKETKDLASKPYVLWQLDFARVFREKGGFDIVIGNPPYVDSEEMTRSMKEQRNYYSRKYFCTKGNWDLFVPFIEKGITLLANKSVMSYIVPNKLISAPYASELRKYMSNNQIIEIRDYSNVKVFKTAAVYPIVFRLKKVKDKIPVITNLMNNDGIHRHNTILPSDFYSSENWDKYLIASKEDLKIINKIAKYPQLISIANVNGAATVSEAYMLKELLYEDDGKDYDKKRFINTGGIDKYKSFYGISEMRYLKDKYNEPVIKVEDLKKISEKRYKESDSEKIIIGGMNKSLECYYDTGDYIAGKSTTIVYNSNILKYLIGILNSKLMNFYYSIAFNSMTLAGGYYRIGAPQIKELPIAIPQKSEIINEVEFLVDKVQNLEKMNSIKQEEIDCIKKEIDFLIYKAYGLKDAEAEYIEKIIVDY